MELDCKPRNRPALNCWVVGQVLRDFRVPEGFAPEDLRAAGDGEVLAVLDLRRDDGLVAAGLARELVNRVQKLRKSAGLVVTDEVEVYYRADGVLSHASSSILGLLASCRPATHACAGCIAAHSRYQVYAET
jgi:Domain of unknown function (DUF5915)